MRILSRGIQVQAYFSDSRIQTSREVIAVVWKLHIPMLISSKIALLR